MVGHVWLPLLNAIITFFSYRQSWIHDNEPGNAMSKLLVKPQTLPGAAASRSAKLLHPPKTLQTRARRRRTDRGSGVALQVSVISGGGAGHEPLHGGFVGRGGDPGHRRTSVAGLDR